MCYYDVLYGSLVLRRYHEVMWYVAASMQGCRGARVPQGRGDVGMASALAVGFVLGLIHATDHLVANRASLCASDIHNGSPRLWQLLTSPGDVVARRMPSAAVQDRQGQRDGAESCGETVRRPLRFHLIPD